MTIKELMEAYDNLSEDQKNNLKNVNLGDLFLFIKLLDGFIDEIENVMDNRMVDDIE